MKNMKFYIAVIILSGSVLTAFGQNETDSVQNNYKNGVNQNPSMNEIPDISKPEGQPEYDNNGDNQAPQINLPPADLKLKDEDSLTMFKKGGALINTDTFPEYPVENPSRTVP